MEELIKYLDKMLKNDDKSEDTLNEKLPESINSLEDFLNWIDKDN